MDIFPIHFITKFIPLHNARPLMIMHAFIGKDSSSRSNSYQVHTNKELARNSAGLSNNTTVGSVHNVRCSNNKHPSKTVMDKLPAKTSIGVVLVDNIPPQTTDSQLSHFFSEIDDVSSIQYICSEGSGNRSCWIHVAKPAETVKKINISTIDGGKPRARLMGYLFAS